jgi:hypothetical protein
MIKAHIRASKTEGRAFLESDDPRDQHKLEKNAAFQADVYESADKTTLKGKHTSVKNGSAFHEE